MPSSSLSGGDFETKQPPYGPAPAPLAGAELPSFRFPLGTVAPKIFQGGTAKEATVAEFPVSDKLAGVYMTLEPGALARAALACQRRRMGLCDRRAIAASPPSIRENQAEIVDFGPGDVWYFPRGHGHSIQGIGPGVCTFVLVFDNGYFSEFGTFSITDWVGHTPPEVLAKNFGVPASTFANFPKSEVYIAKGRCRRPLPDYPAAGHPERRRRSPIATTARAGAGDLSTGGTMRIVSMRDFPISSTMTGALLVIKPGGMRELHWHPNAAEWQFYLKGSGRMTVFGSHGRARTDDFGPGDVGYVPQGYGHYIENTGDSDLEMRARASTTPPISRSPSPPGWPPIPTFCSPPISACRRARLRHLPEGRSGHAGGKCARRQDAACRRSPSPCRERKLGCSPFSRSSPAMSMPTPS